eukprot:3349482-Amphidinium_carterae.1
MLQPHGDGQKRHGGPRPRDGDRARRSFSGALARPSAKMRDERVPTNRARAGFAARSHTSREVGRGPAWHQTLDLPCHMLRGCCVMREGKSLASSTSI